MSLLSSWPLESRSGHYFYLIRIIASIAQERKGIYSDFYAGFIFPYYMRMVYKSVPNIS